MSDSAGNRECWQRYDLTVNRYGGSGGSGYGNGNDFEESPAADPIQAVYPFETVALDIPDTKNGQDFNQENNSGPDGGNPSAVPSVDSSDFIEGAGCWKTTLYNTWNSWQFYGLRESQQLSDHPGAEGTSNAIGTMMFWHKYKAYPMTPHSTIPDSDDHYMEFYIWGFLNISIDSYWARDGNLGSYPPNQSAVVETAGVEHDSYPVIDKWYHYTFWKDGNTGARKISIYDPIAEAILGTDKEWTTTPDTLPYPSYPFDKWGIETVMSSDANWEDSSEVVAEQWCDEFVIAKTWLSDADVLKVRQGTYPS